MAKRTSHIDLYNGNDYNQQLKIVEMRTAGYTYQQIGDHLDLHPKTVSNIVERFYDEVVSPTVNELRGTLTDQAFTLIKHFMPKAKAGDVRSAELVLKCIERVSKMHGVEKEVNINLHGKNGQPWDQVFSAVLVEQPAIEGEVINDE